MKKKTLTYLIIGIVIIILAVVGIIKQANSPGQYDDFAKCLTESGAIMYGTDWCPHCKDQKALFGKSFKKVNYINCDFNKQECVTMGVEGYPTWFVDDEKYTGVQPLGFLSSTANISF